MSADDIVRTLPGVRMRQFSALNGPVDSSTSHDDPEGMDGPLESMHNVDSDYR